MFFKLEKKTLKMFLTFMFFTIRHYTVFHKKSLFSFFYKPNLVELWPIYIIFLLDKAEKTNFKYFYKMWLLVKYSLLVVM